MASSGRGIAKNTSPMAAATESPIIAANCADRALRSGCPAPRFCPATAAVAPMSPFDVKVITEKSWVYPTAYAACDSELLPGAKFCAECGAAAAARRRRNDDARHSTATHAGRRGCRATG